MPIPIGDSALLVFQGDSITAAGRDTDDPADLGNGFVRMVAERLSVLHPRAGVLNRGVSGNRVADLRARWATDAIDLRPDLLSVMIGVNDTWHRYTHGIRTPVERFDADYRGLLRQATAVGARLVLVEPFLVPVRSEQWDWHADLDARIHVVRRLAAEFDTVLLSADGLLNQAAREAGDPAKIADDGVHLTVVGHSVLADAWIRLILE
ncbi:SGNH/GDSL hydrolase family protein [Streptomyces sp. NEAU-W12]|uniref:SGNH/GDSL hydrolase family protein n=1 Tax=Streptomyces sp. NEAU-W12 TaxID=2994668 RepID=UPI00224AC908|nr:GDSL-type esterase/lipase family protein [Streptomyces sp. NEAU-W12]MCX2928226.1 GDSL-type esterase/lipase family protein [Streptomyces sp. NEAU-W12]